MVTERQNESRLVFSYIYEMCVCRERRSARADIMITIMIYMTSKEMREKRKAEEKKN